METPAPTAAPVSKRVARSAAPSIIAGDVVVNGTLTSSGDMQIDGRIEGDVHSTDLVIGDKAFIHGEVVAEDVTVRGRVQGSIRARKVLLCSTCHVEGNILHEALAIEAGAFFEGNCRHADNPLSEENNRKLAEFRSAAPVVAPTAVAPAMPKSEGMAAAAAPKSAASFAPLNTGA